MHTQYTQKHIAGNDLEQWKKEIKKGGWKGKAEKCKAIPAGLPSKFLHRSLQWLDKR